MAKLISGQNDLQTLFPEIGREAHDWDPKLITAGSNRKLPWKCPEGHIWECSAGRRTKEGAKCPYCQGRKVLTGFNDAATVLSHLVSGAVDPELLKKYTAGSKQQIEWQCKEGHKWKAAIKTRANGSGCPVCCKGGRGNIIAAGFNDLPTIHPEIASEAFGWNPSGFSSHADTKHEWQCDKGHVWTTSIRARVQGQGCPVCSGFKTIAGINDIATLFPEVAKEAHGWDPHGISPGSNKRYEWICSLGHTWQAVASKRTHEKSNCPYCSNLKCWPGFNDLATVNPEIAKEACGWDPTTVIYSSQTKRKFKCGECGLEWNVQPGERARRGTGCPSCAKSGYDPSKPGYFYLMQRPGEQQFGITTNFAKRMADHKSNGWTLIEHVGPFDGKEVQETESSLKKWLKTEIGLIDGSTENWLTSKIEFRSLRELFKYSGIKPFWEGKDGEVDT